MMSRNFNAFIVKITGDLAVFLKVTFAKMENNFLTKKMRYIGITIDSNNKSTIVSFMQSSSEFRQRSCWTTSE